MHDHQVMAYLSNNDYKKLKAITRESGLSATVVLVTALHHLYQSPEDWPVAQPETIREHIQSKLIKLDMTLVEWCERQGFQLGSVNGVLDRLEKGKKVGWKQLSNSSLIIDCIEELTGLTDLRDICKDPARTYDGE